MEVEEYLACDTTLHSLSYFPVLPYHYYLQQSPYRYNKLTLKLQSFPPQPHLANTMDPFFERLKNSLLQCYQTLQTAYQESPVGSGWILRALIYCPIFIRNLASPPSPHSSSLTPLINNSGQSNRSSKRCQQELSRHRPDNPNTRRHRDTTRRKQDGPICKRSLHPSAQRSWRCDW